MEFVWRVAAEVRREAPGRAGRPWAARTWLMRVMSAGSRASLGAMVAPTASPAEANAQVAKNATKRVLARADPFRLRMRIYLGTRIGLSLPRMGPLQETCRVSDTGEYRHSDGCSVA